MEPGDRVFLLKQGREPRGIMGSGRVVTDVYPDDHWDAVRRRAGDKALYVDVDFDRILDPESDEILLLSVLKHGAMASVNWGTQSSGISLDAVAEELERIWRAHLRVLDDVNPNDEDFSLSEGAQRLAMVRHRKREGILREKKIAQVLRKHGCLRCEVPECGFDFFEVYGEIGLHFAHVHHLAPLTDRATASPTKLTDLAIVCPNCHAMIHRGGENRPLQALFK
jgi:hypothetical protein